MLTYNRIYQILIKARDFYDYEATQPSKRFQQKNRRFKKLAGLAEVLAEEFENRFGAIATDEVEITKSPEVIAGKVGVSVSTLKNSYMPNISLTTGLRYVFKSK